MHAPTYINEAEREQYHIYSLFLESEYINRQVHLNKNELKYFVVADSTSGRMKVGSIGEKHVVRKLEGQDSTLVQQWLDLNRQKYPLLNKYANEKDVKLFNYMTYYPLNSVEFWEQFWEDYPKSNGIIEFSRIGYNEQRDKAILHIIHSFGNLGASAYFVIFSKEDDQWEMVERIPHWAA